MIGFDALLPVLLFIAGESAVVVAINEAGEHNTTRYNTSSVVLLVEFTKLVISLAGLSKVDGGFKQLTATPLPELAKYAIPGLLYAFNNNVFHQVLSSSMPAAFQVLLQLRALWTGVMFWFLMGRKLSGKQWVALVILCAGAILSQTAVFEGDDPMGDKRSSLAFQALLMTIMYTLASVGAGVYNELLLKKGGTSSIHLANVPLYAWGVFFNLLTLMIQGQNMGSLWVGWDRISTWIIMLLQAVTGLLISVVVKRFDNIVKILCVAASNAIVYVIGVVFSGYPLTMNFIGGAVLVLSAAVLYTMVGNAAASKVPPKSPQQGSDLRAEEEHDEDEGLELTSSVKPRA